MCRCCARIECHSDVATASACPFVPLKAVTAYDPAGTRQRDCVDFYRGTVRALLEKDPSLVIIGTRVDRYLASYGLERLGSTRPVTTLGAKRDLWAEALRSVLSELARRGIPVVVLQPLPLMPTDIGSCASLLLLEDRCRGRIARTRADQALTPALTAERAGTHDLAGVKLIDLSSAICDRTTCSGDRNGVEMFLDGEHLSVQGAKSMTPRFAQIILAHARRPSH